MITMTDTTTTIAYPSDVLDCAAQILESGSVKDPEFLIVNALLQARREAEARGYAVVSGAHYYAQAAAMGPLTWWLLEVPRSVNDMTKLLTKAADLAREAGE